MENTMKLIFMLALLFSPINKAEILKLIEEALKIELLPTNNIISEEARNIAVDNFEHIKEGNYQKAFEEAYSALKKFPNDFIIQADFAMILGDYSELFSDQLRKRMIQKSCECFNKLITEADAHEKSIIYWFKNEYYYRFGMYQEQYELGLQRVANYWGTDQWHSKGISGYYSQGVGSANYAKLLLGQGKASLAFDYAQKALVAWSQYFSYDNSYYNAYVHYALALGILGYEEEMRKALEHSASLINKDLSYIEFKEVIDYISHINYRIV